MAIDVKNKILYSIECKRTKQAKIYYEFKQDIENYLSKQLPKHQNRESYLKQNLDKVSELIKHNVENYTVKSIVVSSNILPIKFLKEVSIPILSLNQLDSNQGQLE